MAKQTPLEKMLWHLRQDLSTNLMVAINNRFPGTANWAAALEKESGVSDTVIRRLVNDPHGQKGKYYYPTIETLLKLANPLGVTAESLLHSPRSKPQPGGGGGNTSEVAPAVETDVSQTPGRPLIHEPA
jgi:transcriptional regulator with XRE-family HTH domain